VPDGPPFYCDKMTEEKNSLIDRIIRNAHILGRMSGKVDKWGEKPWLIDDECKELVIRRFYEIKHEQEVLVKQLKGMEQ
jgi:hypothetical protein